MADIIIPNIVYTAGNYVFKAIWQMTRAMKAAGWRYKASSNTGTKDTSGDPFSDTWGSGQVVSGRTATGEFTIGTVTSTKEMGQVTISGGTIAGFTTTGGSSLSGSIGRYLKITNATNSANNGTWQIITVNSSTSVQVVNPAAIAETTPSNCVWSEYDALLDVIQPASIADAGGGGAWWCAQGASTMKVPISNTVPTGSFLVGETVTQTYTRATGELLGVMTDIYTSTGFLTVNPKNTGIGNGVRGWQDGYVVTGNSSGATITTIGTVLEYITEVVIWKSNDAINGHIYIQCIDIVNESTLTATNGRFSVMAALASCTLTVCPGGAASGVPTTNGFPTTGTLIFFGAGGAGTYNNLATYWRGGGFESTAGTVYGGGNVIVSNCLSSSNYSADGSFTYLQILDPTRATFPGINYACQGFSYMRLKNTEDGDLFPFVQIGTVNEGGTTYATNSRTYVAQWTGSGGSPNILFSVYGIGNYSSLTVPFIRGWRRRGFSSGDAFQAFHTACLGSYNSTSVCAAQTLSPDYIACAYSNIIATEPIWIISDQLLSKNRKGTLKWMVIGTTQPSNFIYTNGANTYVPISQPWYCPTLMAPWNPAVPFKAS